MYLTYVSKISEKPLHSSYEEGTLELPKRLGERNYPNLFNVLKSWDLVRTFAIINLYKLIFNCIHLLEQAQFDEN